jgi:carboxyl-terminal processing protease
MQRVLKHMALLGVALPTSLMGYHALAGRSPGAGGAVPAHQELVDAVQGFALGDRHDLSDLELLERNLYHVEHRYVEKARLDPEAMFGGALEGVERDIGEVMFVREPGGRRLQVSVGAFSTVLLVEPISSFDVMVDQLRRVAAVLEDNLSEEIDQAEVEYLLINGALSTLDPHTVLLPPEAAREMEVDNQGEFGGLGVEIKVDSGGWLVVAQPMDGTPAHKAGLKAGDRILRIEDESTVNMDLSDAVDRLRGEVGTQVRILVEREGDKDDRTFTITRARIEVFKVEGELLEGAVGYVRIPSFHRNVSANLDELLARFKRESGGELRGLVLDLRDNPGGYLNQAFEVSNRFLGDGVVVSTVEGGNRRREEQRATRQGTEPDYPIVVLVNGNSASASEIVAGALRNRDRAVIIGERSFGKGSVQHLYRNKDESNLKLTVAKYLTPGDHSIQSVGIPPDILLQPSVVRPGEDGGEPLVSLYWREWTDRESDLDRHLAQVDRALEPATWQVRYLRPPSDGDEPDPRSDWEVDFSRRVLLAASSARRADVLRAAQPVVEGARRTQEQAIVRAFKDVGVDWTEGLNEARPALDVGLDLGEDGALVAGVEEEVTLRVTNSGPTPLSRLSAWTESENPWLDHKEFYVGRLAPGETRELRTKVDLHEGYLDEVTPVTVHFRDPSSAELSSHTVRARAEAAPLPAFSYTLRVVDDGSGRSQGDGDGLPEAGEIIDLEITVHNTGGGASAEAFGRIGNKSGRALDLSRGRVRFGEALDAAGAPCPRPEADGCERELAPDGTAVDRFSFTLRELPEDAEGWELELRVGDNARYDYGAIQRGGFAEYFQVEERLLLKPGEPFDGQERVPPRVRVTRAPELETTRGHVVLSGVVEDDESVRDVLVFHGEDKVFYQGGRGGEPALPFSVEPELDAGPNLLTVLARDDRGLKATWSQAVWLETPAATAMAKPDEP